MQVSVLTYDPHDRLDLPGDTHTLQLGSFAELSQEELPDGRLSATLDSYRCGPHDPSASPQELSCPGAGVRQTVAVDRARLDFPAAGTVRIRGAVAGRRIDLTVTGSGAAEAFVHAWRHAEGTRRDSGRTVATDYASATSAGSFGPVAVTGVSAWLRTYRTTVSSGTGPALAVPALPAPGTEQGGWSTVAVVSASWLRSLSAGPAGSGDQELGRLTGRAGGGDLAGVDAQITHHSCPGTGPVPVTDRCTLLATSSGNASTSMAVDLAAGSARVLDVVSMTDLVSTAPEPGRDAVADLAVEVRWHGGLPVGFHELDTLSGPNQPSSSRERIGVRWNGVTAAGTVAGTSIVALSDLSFFGYREKVLQDG